MRAQTLFTSNLTKKSLLWDVNKHINLRPVLGLDAGVIIFSTSRLYSGTFISQCHYLFLQKNKRQKSTEVLMRMCRNARKTALNKKRLQNVKPDG